MGTYTTNKNLFMPTVGETGWGTLVNGNFETIDNFLKPITVSGNTYTFTGNLVGNQSGGTISATSISATTGKFSGAVTGASFNGVTIGSNAFNNVRVEPILSTSIFGKRVYTCGNTSQVIFNIQPAVSVSNGTYTIGRPILSTDYLISVYDVPNNLTYELSVLFSGSVSCTVKISGSISKTLTYSSTSHVELNLTYNEVVNFIRKNTTLTISGLSGNTTLNSIRISATASNTTYVYLVY